MLVLARSVSIAILEHAPPPWTPIPIFLGVRTPMSCSPGTSIHPWVSIVLEPGLKTFQSDLASPISWRTQSPILSWKSHRHEVRHWAQDRTPPTTASHMKPCHLVLCGTTHFPRADVFTAAPPASYWRHTYKQGRLSITSSATVGVMRKEPVIFKHSRRCIFPSNFFAHSFSVRPWFNRSNRRAEHPKFVLCPFI